MLYRTRLLITKLLNLLSPDVLDMLHTLFVIINNNMRYESYSPIENSLIGPQLLKTAEEKARMIREQYSPNLAPFMDDHVYGRKAVFSDLQEVQRMEKQFERNSAREIEAKRVSDIFEAYFVDAASQMQWFGKKSNVMRTTRFDDYKNGVDAITTFSDEQDRHSHLAMSTDLTFGLDASMDKIEGIMSDISQGKMSRVRYFHSDQTGYTGTLNNLPKTVIGLDAEHLPNFIRLWTHDQSSPELIDTRNILISQLYHQLRTFTEFADKKHGESTIRNSYAQASRQISELYNHLQLNDARIPKDSITERVAHI